jgi:hypothetical protein
MHHAWINRGDSGPQSVPTADIQIANAAITDTAAPVDIFPWQRTRDAVEPIIQTATPPWW